MTVKIESSPLWDAQLCAMFVGVILYSKDPDLTKLATTNFLRFYKILPAEGKKMIRASIATIKKDPSALFDAQIDLINDIKDSGLLDDINKDAL